MMTAAQPANAGIGIVASPSNGLPERKSQGDAGGTPFASVFDSERSGAVPVKNFASTGARKSNDTRPAAGRAASTARAKTKSDSIPHEDLGQRAENAKIEPPSASNSAMQDARTGNSELAQSQLQDGQTTASGFAANATLGLKNPPAEESSHVPDSESDNASAGTVANVLNRGSVNGNQLTSAEILFGAMDGIDGQDDFNAAATDANNTRDTQEAGDSESNPAASSEPQTRVERGEEELNVESLTTTLQGVADPIDVGASATLSIGQSPDDTFAPAKANAEAKAALPIVAKLGAPEVGFHLQLPPIDSQVQILAAGGANGSSHGKESGSSNENGSPSETQISSKEVAATVVGVAANHSDNSSNSGDNTQKDSNSDSAAAANTAGLTAVAGDESLHVPVDAPAQSTGTAAGSSSSGTSGADIPAAARALPFSAQQPTSLSDVAKAGELYQRVGGAEMHISMDTELLGSIDVRAVMHQSTLTATIGVQRAEVQALLSNELPALQHSLKEQNMQVEQISVTDNSTGGRMEMSGHSQQQQNSPSAPIRKFMFEEGAASPEGTPPVETGAPVWAIGAGRLSIHV
jgi:flagellar hook-length control protein FliK